jgi:hypothetical protein
MGNSLCHDGIRASGSYQNYGVFRLCVNQSFRKPVRPFAHQALNIRQAGKNLWIIPAWLDVLFYAGEGLYSSPRAKSAHITLAVLLARATAVTGLPRRPQRFWSHN